ncbi:hypothetical protein Hanom_Chr08g00703101 [Helianthus anomalus]
MNNKYENTVDASDRGSYDGEDDGEFEMKDDVADEDKINEVVKEDGECTPPIAPVQVSGSRPETELRCSPENTLSPEGVRLEPNERPDAEASVRVPSRESQRLHGEEEMHATFNDVVGKENKTAKVSGCGPQLLEERESSKVGNPIVEGPTPVNGLGKRPRNVRSPPSIGSLQGPAHKTFDHFFGAGESSLDLNRPLSCPGSDVD